MAFRQTPVSHAMVSTGAAVGLDAKTSQTEKAREHVHSSFSFSEPCHGEEYGEERFDQA